MKDLNLLRILVAVHEAGSVSDAAARLNVSQPSVSQALARLRDVTGDILFVRGPRGVVPTVYASQLYRECLPALHQLESVFLGDRSFDPATAREQFTIALSDLGEITFLPLLLERLSAVAPAVSLEVTPLIVADAATALKAGKIDFAIGNLAANDPDIMQRTLFDETYVCIIRRSRTDVEDTLTEDAFWHLGHAVVSGASGHWQVPVIGLGDRDRHIDVRISVPHFIALPWAVAQSDLIAVVPSKTARMFASMWGVRVVGLPFYVPPFQVRQLWHDHPGNRSLSRSWMSDLIRDVLCEDETSRPRLAKDADAD